MKKRLPILLTAVAITTALCCALLFSVTSVAETTYAAQRAETLWNGKGTPAAKIDWVLVTETADGEGTVTQTETEVFSLASGTSTDLAQAAPDYYTGGTAALSADGILTVTGAVQKEGAPLLKMKVSGALKIDIKGTDYPANVAVSGPENSHLLITSTEGKRLVATSVSSAAGGIAVYGDCGLLMENVGELALSIQAKGKDYPLILGGTVSSTVIGSTDGTHGLIFSNASNIEFCNESSSSSLTIENTYKDRFETDGTTRGATVTIASNAKADSMILFKNQGPVNITCGSGHAVRNKANVGVGANYGTTAEAVEYTYPITVQNEDGTTTETTGTATQSITKYTKSADAIVFEGDGKVTVTGTGAFVYSWRQNPGLVRAEEGCIRVTENAQVAISQTLTTYGKDSASSCAIALNVANGASNPYAGLYVEGNGELAVYINGASVAPNAEDREEIVLATDDETTPEDESNTLILSTKQERIVGTWVNYGHVTVTGNGKFTSYTHRKDGSGSLDQCSAVCIKVGQFNVEENGAAFLSAQSPTNCGCALELQSGNDTSILVTEGENTVTHTFSEGYLAWHQYNFGVNKVGAENATGLKAGLNVTGGQLELVSSYRGIATGHLQNILGSSYNLTGGVVLIDGKNQAISNGLGSADVYKIENAAYCGKVGDVDFSATQNGYSATSNNGWVYFADNADYTYYDGIASATSNIKATPVLASNDGKTFKFPANADGSATYRISEVQYGIYGNYGQTFTSKKNAALTVSITKDVPERHLLITENDGITYVFPDDASDTAASAYQCVDSGTKGTLTFTAASDRKDKVTVNGLSGIRKIEAPTGSMTMTVTGTNTVSNPQERAIYVSYAGGDLTVNGSGTLTASATTEVLFAPGGNLTVEDLTLNLTAQTRAIANATDTDVTGKTLNISNATINLTAAEKEGTAYLILNKNGTVLNVTGSTVNATVNNDAMRLFYTDKAVSTFHNASVTVNNAEQLESVRFLHSKQGELYLTGSTAIKVSYGAICGLEGIAPVFRMEDTAVAESLGHNADTITINCNVESTGNNAVTFELLENSRLTIKESASCPIRVRTYIGEKTVTNADGTTSKTDNLVPGVPVSFKVTDDAVLEAEGDGQCIYLRSATETGSVTMEISGNAQVTVHNTVLKDGDNATYTGLSLVSGTAASPTGSLIIKDNASLTGSCDENSKDGQAAFYLHVLKEMTVQDNATVTVNGAKYGILAQNATNINITNGTVDLNDITYSGIYLNKGSVLTQNGGTVEITQNPTVSGGAGIVVDAQDNAAKNTQYVLNGGSVTINNTLDGIWAYRGGTFVQNGGDVKIDTSSRANIRITQASSYTLAGGTLTLLNADDGIYSSDSGSFSQTGGVFDAGNIKDGIQVDGTGAVSLTGGSTEIRAGTKNGAMFYFVGARDGDAPRMTIGAGATVTGYGQTAINADGNARTGVVLYIVPGAKIKVQGFGQGHDLYGDAVVYYSDEGVTYHEDCAMKDHGKDYIITDNMPQEKLAVVITVYDENGDPHVVNLDSEETQTYPKGTLNTENAMVTLVSAGQVEFKNIQNVRRIVIEGTATVTVYGTNLIENLNKTTNAYEAYSLESSMSMTVTGDSGAILTLKAHDYALMSKETLNLLGDLTINIETTRIDKSGDTYNGLGSPIHIARGTQYSSLVIRENVKLNIGQLNETKTGIATDGDGNPYPSRGYGLYVPGTNTAIEILEDAQVNICCSNRGIYLRGDTVAMDDENNPDLTAIQRSMLHIGGNAKVDVKAWASGIYLEQSFSMYNDANENPKYNLQTGSTYNNLLTIDGSATVTIDINETWRRGTYSYKDSEGNVSDVTINAVNNATGIRLGNHTNGRNEVDLSGSATVTLKMDREQSGIYLQANENTTGNTLLIRENAQVTVDTLGHNLHLKSEKNSVNLEKNELFIQDGATVTLAGDGGTGIYVHSDTETESDNILTIQDQSNVQISFKGNYGIGLDNCGTGDNVLTVADTQDLKIGGSLQAGIRLWLHYGAETQRENRMKISNAAVTIDNLYEGTGNLKGDGIRIQTDEADHGNQSLQISNSTVTISVDNSETDGSKNLWGIVLYNMGTNTDETGNTLTIDNGSKVTVSSGHIAIEVNDRGAGENTMTVDNATLHITKAEHRGIAILDGNTANADYTMNNDLNIVNGANVTIENAENLGIYMLKSVKGINGLTVGDAEETERPASLTVKSEGAAVYFNYTGTDTVGRNEMLVQGNAALHLENTFDSAADTQTNRQALRIYKPSGNTVRDDIRISTVGTVTMIGRCANRVGAIHLDGSVSATVTAPDITVKNLNNRTVTIKNAEMISNAIYLNDGASVTFAGNANAQIYAERTGASQNRAHAIFSNSGGSVTVRDNAFVSLHSHGTVTKNTGAAIHLKESSLTVTDNGRLYLKTTGTGSAGLTLEGPLDPKDGLSVSSSVSLSGNAYMEIDVTEAAAKGTLNGAIWPYYDGTKVKIDIQNNGKDNNAILVIKGKPVVNYRNWTPTATTGETIRAGIYGEQSPQILTLSASAAPDESAFTAWTECGVLAAVMIASIIAFTVAKKRKNGTKLKHSKGK